MDKDITVVEVSEGELCNLVAQDVTLNGVTLRKVDREYLAWLRVRWSRRANDPRLIELRDVLQRHVPEVLSPRVKVPKRYRGPEPVSFPIWESASRWSERG